MTGLFLDLLNLSLSALPLILAVLLLRLLLRRAPRYIMPILWGVAALRLVLPFSIESALSLVPSAEPINVEAVQLYAPSANITAAPAGSAAPVIDTGIPAVNSAVNGVVEQMAAAAPGDSVSPLYVLASVSAAVYVIGLAALLVWALMSYMGLKNRVSTAVELSPGVYASEHVSSPFVLGVLRPRIYVPSGLDGGALGHVLAHERAHVARRDTLVKPLGYAVLCLHWFNPLVWLGYILFCRDIEAACDERVVRGLDRAGRADYSEALLRCASGKRLVSACPLAFGEGSVKNRVKSVLSYKKPAFWIIAVCVIAIIVLAVCFLTNPAEEPAVRETELPDGIMIDIGFETDVEPGLLSLVLGHITDEVGAKNLGEKVHVELEALSTLMDGVLVTDSAGVTHSVTLLMAPYRYGSVISSELSTGGYDDILIAYSDETGSFIGSIDALEFQSSYGGDAAAAASAVINKTGIVPLEQDVYAMISRVDAGNAPSQCALTPEQTAELLELVENSSGGSPDSARYLVTFFETDEDGIGVTNSKSYSVSPGSTAFERVNELYAMRYIIDYGTADISEALSSAIQFLEGEGAEIERVWYDQAASSIKAVQALFNARLSGVVIDEHNYLPLYFRGSYPGYGETEYGQLLLTRADSSAPWSVRFLGESLSYELDTVVGTVIQMQSFVKPEVLFSGAAESAPEEVKAMISAMCAGEADDIAFRQNVEIDRVIVDGITAYEAESGEYNREGFKLTYYRPDYRILGDLDGITLYGSFALEDGCLVNTNPSCPLFYVKDGGYEYIGSSFISLLDPGVRTSNALSLYAQWLVAQDPFTVEDVELDGALAGLPEEVLLVMAEQAASIANDYRISGLTVGSGEGSYYEIDSVRLDSVAEEPTDAGGEGETYSFFIPGVSLGTAYGPEPEGLPEIAYLFRNSGGEWSLVSDRPLNYIESRYGGASARDMFTAAAEEIINENA